jgi:TPP-dependent pyruvate/acetoin dehydrogenase alpha subunit
VREVYTVASKYVERARKGEGPAFLQCITYRYHGHHVGDNPRAYYRPQADCIMFTRENVPFCAVCRRAIEQILDLYSA